MMRCSVQSRAFEDPGQASFVHDGDAIAEVQDLLHVAADHQDGHALARQAAQQPVDFRLGADVDAARGLVDDQHLRPERQPLRQHHLLLVAAAQGRGPDLDRRSLDLQLIADRRRRPAAPASRRRARAASTCRAPAATRSRESRNPRRGPPAGDPRERGRSRAGWRPAGSSIRSGCPSRLTVPAIGGSTPNIARAISDRPAPTRPAIPRISPRPTANDTACCGYRRVRSPSTRKSLAARRALRRIVLDVDVAADHQPDHVVVGELAARRACRRWRRRAARPPDRRRPRTSPSRCVM